MEGGSREIDDRVLRTRRRWGERWDSRDVGLWPGSIEMGEGMGNSWQVVRCRGQIWYDERPDLNCLTGGWMKSLSPIEIAPSCVPARPRHASPQSDAAGRACPQFSTFGSSIFTVGSCRTFPCSKFERFTVGFQPGSFTKRHQTEQLTES